jgi:hypothetical protein
MLDLQGIADLLILFDKLGGKWNLFEYHDGISTKENACLCRDINKTSRLSDLWHFHIST